MRGTIGDDLVSVLALEDLERSLARRPTVDRRWRRRPSVVAAARAGPQGFPWWIRLYRQRFENWSGETKVDDVWTCAPETPAAVVAVVNWAHQAGFTVRPRVTCTTGRRSRSPATRAAAAKVVLVDTTRSLTAMGMVAGDPGVVRTEAGASMEQLLTFLEANGMGLGSVPAVGDITVGGALAIMVYAGAATAAAGEAVDPGLCLGSLSNAVLSCSAIVWSPMRTATSSAPSPERIRRPRRWRCTSAGPS